MVTRFIASIMHVCLFMSHVDTSVTETAEWKGFYPLKKITPNKSACCLIEILDVLVLMINFLLHPKC
jgi:hypothetical protein